MLAAGPANCTTVGGAGSTDDVEPQDEAEVGDNCAAVLDGGVDDITPVQIWDQIMRRYKVALACDQELHRLRDVDNSNAKADLKLEQAKAVAAAVEALSNLQHQEVRKKLQQFVAASEREEPLSIPHTGTFLNNHAPLFWYSCFVRLFPRGDCAEKCAARPQHLTNWRWAKTLLTRADFVLWRQDVEFIACVYNVHLRRDQVRAVEVVMSQQDQIFTVDQKADLAKLTATGLVAHALASGDVDSVREALRRKDLDRPLEIALRKMQVVQRTVRGSESERDNLLPRFLALRLWCGCASLFFTLNPHDIRSPITMVLLQGDAKFETEFSLDLSDEETDRYIASFLQQNPRRLHEAVAGNPLAATRCFHWTVKLVLRTLFNCDETPGGAVDSVAARETPGLFGYVRGYLGVVEPQMRKALHIHMLVYLLGFGHPADLFSSKVLPTVFRRLWYFIASISFRSTEAFAHYLKVDAAMEELAQEPLLPLTKKQRGMIGEARTHESLQAQLAARGLVAVPAREGAAPPMSFTTSTVHGNASVDASEWARVSVKNVASGTRKAGNHVCRPDVCHKGPLGRKGFCRMMFWHWARYGDDKKGPVAKRSHGLALQPRWNGTGDVPLHKDLPFLGCPALEINHPFHFKMTPGVMLGPKCNHDLGVLLRLSTQSTAGAHQSLDRERAISGMLDSMGDHEYYCASYSTKDQPHIEGLLTTLADSLRAKERDVLVAREAGEEVSQHEIARQILHRLVAATNRRMHKGFQEMLTYLLRKPMTYCSHKFVSLNIDIDFRRAIRLVYILVGKAPYSGGSADGGLSMPLHTKPYLNPSDYPFRPSALETFPLYFFMASCVAHDKLCSRSLDWVSIAVADSREPSGLFF